MANPRVSGTKGNIIVSSALDGPVTITVRKFVEGTLVEKSLEVQREDLGDLIAALQYVNREW